MTESRARALIDKKLSAPEMQEVEGAFTQTCGAPFASAFNQKCPNRHNDALIAILRAIRIERCGGYDLRRGVVIKHDSGLYTWQNLTKEIAEDWLKGDQSRAKYFNKLPNT